MACCLLMADKQAHRETMCASFTVGQAGRRQQMLEIVCWTTIFPIITSKRFERKKWIWSATSKV